MLLAKSTDSYKGSVWWGEFDKWRGRKRRRETTWWKGRLGGFCGGIPDAPDAPVPLQTLPVACLSACQPAILSASLAETERGSERGSEEQRWARWCRGGTGEISGAQALPVKSDMTFWFCHLSPTAMSDSALRSACHPPLFSSASVSPSLRLSECLSVFFCLLLLPLHLLFLVLLFFSRVEVFMGGGGGSGGATFWRSWGIIGSVSSFFPSSFLNIYFSVPVLCVALNEGRCHGTVCLETQTGFFLFFFL